MELSLLSEYLLKVADVYRHFSWVNLLDIALVAVIVYVILKQLRRSQSIQIIIGVGLVGVLYLIISSTGMEASKFLFNKVFGDIIIIFAVIFAPELRRGLEGLGNGSFLKKLFVGGSSDETDRVINSIVSAAKHMSSTKVGSLMIIQRDSLLGDLTGGGVTVDAVISDELLGNIFYPKSPLHDGAVVIEGGRIVAARCVVPLRDKAKISSGYGTRHRAAIEVSQYSDAIVVVTSEERGQISFAKDGQLMQNISSAQLYDYLTDNLAPRAGREKSFLPQKKKEKTVKQSQKNAGGDISIDDIVLPGEEKKTEPEADVCAAEVPEILTITNEGDADNDQE